jgi:short-subunit dehydrogenase
MRFANKVVWVTGASSGIGAGVAAAFHREGARVILSSRRREALDVVHSGLEDRDRATVLPFDVTDPEGVAAAAREALSRFGGIDVLVHSAGISQRSLAKDTKVAVVRRLMEVDFFGPVALTRAVLPSMLERRSGHIVVISSLVGKFGTPMRSGYAASKHALHGYFDSLRAEVRVEGVDVTLVCPGFIRTEITLHAVTGDGTPYGKVDGAVAEGLPVERCARAVLDGVHRRRREVLVGGPEIFAVYLNRFLPGLFAWGVSHAKVI